MKQTHKITCEKCYHNWDGDNKNEEFYFCHKCGFDNKNKKFNLLKLKNWMKNNQKIVSENYKLRLQKLAGIINERFFMNDEDSKNFFFQQNQIPGNAEFKYSITYQEVDKSQFADGEDISDYTDQGFEVEESIDELYSIIDQAKSNYGTYEPSSSPVSAGCSWSSTSPEMSRAHIEKGLDKFYSLHITHLDGSELSKEESEFITMLLNPSKRVTWDDIDNKWKI